MRPSRNQLLEPQEGDVVVFLLAHPDDESLFTGGTIAHVANEGATTVVVTATLGERGRRNKALARATQWDRIPLRSVRLEELRAACVALGVTDHFLLGGAGRFVDSGYDRKAWRANSFANNVTGAATELISLLRSVNPHVLVTFDRDGCTGHPDHVVCHEIGLRAATTLSMLGGRFRGMACIVDPLRSDRRGHQSRGTDEVIEVDISGVRDRRNAAIRCHVSQVGDTLDDRTRPTLVDVGRAVARYIPYLLSAGHESCYERFVWLTANELAAVGAV